MHSSVCLESATAVARAEFAAGRRWADDRNGITSQRQGGEHDAAVECSASADPSRARTESTVT